MDLERAVTDPEEVECVVGQALPCDVLGDLLHHPRILLLKSRLLANLIINVQGCLLANLIINAQTSISQPNIIKSSLLAKLIM